MNKWTVIIALLLFVSGCLSAQTVHEARDSVKMYFRQGKIDLVPSFCGNQSALDRIADSLRTSYADSVYRLQKILVMGGASPEGSQRDKHLGHASARLADSGNHQEAQHPLMKKS